MNSCRHHTSKRRSASFDLLMQPVHAYFRSGIDAHRHRFSFHPRSLLLLIAGILVLVAGASTGLAEATPTPTPERPYSMFLPIVVQGDTPPRPVTVTFQRGTNFYLGADETFISSYGDPYATHGFDPIIAVRWDRSQITDPEAGLSQWDLTSIPVSATIQTAALRLYVTGRSNTNPMTLSAYGVLRPWQPWASNWYSATVSTAWAEPGCNGIDTDRRGLATSSVDFSDIGIWIELPVTSLVQDWVSHPSTNYGLALKPTGTSLTSSVRYEMASSLYPERLQRPILSVTYVLLPVGPPTPTPTATATATATRTPTVTATPTGSATPPAISLWLPTIVQEQ
jgi:hypothetical protein